MGSNFGDLDDDGWLDFYLGTGYPDYEGLMPNVMYRGVEGEASPTSRSRGVGHLQKGHAVAIADWDGDGDEDLFAQIGGAYPGDRFADALFENPGNSSHWIGVELVGTRSNRAGIGGRVRVDTVVAGERRSIHRQIGNGGSFGCNPLRQTIGLGRADRVERLECGGRRAASGRPGPVSPPIPSCASSSRADPSTLVTLADSGRSPARVLLRSRRWRAPSVAAPSTAPRSVHTRTPSASFSCFIQRADSSVSSTRWFRSPTWTAGLIGPERKQGEHLRLAGRDRVHEEMIAVAPTSWPSSCRRKAKLEAFALPSLRTRASR